MYILYPCFDKLLNYSLILFFLCRGLFSGGFFAAAFLTLAFRLQLSLAAAFFTVSQQSLRQQSLRAAVFLTFPFTAFGLATPAFFSSFISFPAVHLLAYPLPVLKLTNG
ncbi:MAG: hypothetical protein MZV63_24960 [Marinilabiliales bacterium]|nr:hypothetical protein [Marinilabiliales bacterium]